MASKHNDAIKRIKLSPEQKTAIQSALRMMVDLGTELNRINDAGIDISELESRRQVLVERIQSLKAAFLGTRAKV